MHAETVVDEHEFAERWIPASGIRELYRAAIIERLGAMGAMLLVHGDAAAGIEELADAAAEAHPRALYAWLQKQCALLAEARWRTMRDGEDLASPLFLGAITSHFGILPIHGEAFRAAVATELRSMVDRGCILAGGSWIIRGRPGKSAPTAYWREEELEIAFEPSDELASLLPSVSKGDGASAGGTLKFLILQWFADCGAIARKTQDPSPVDVLRRNLPRALAGRLSIPPLSQEGMRFRQLVAEELASHCGRNGRLSLPSGELDAVDESLIFYPR